MEDNLSGRRDLVKGPMRKVVRQVPEPQLVVEKAVAEMTSLRGDISLWMEAYENRTPIHSHRTLACMLALTHIKKHRSIAFLPIYSAFIQGFGEPLFR